MDEYLANHDGPIDLQRLYEFGMRHHRAPEEITAHIARVATDEDRILMADNQPKISPSTWLTIRDDVLRSSPKVDYIFSINREKEVRVAVKAALADLGDTPESIRSALASKGIRGKQLRSCWCPIANYLRVRLHTDAVEVDGHAIQVNGVYVHQTEPARGFIGSFDDGQYPELQHVNDVRMLATPFGD